MDVQNLIVAVIVLLALVYVGTIIRRKIKSFSTKNSCAADCGCAGSSKSKAAKI